MAGRGLAVERRLQGDPLMEGIPKEVGERFEEARQANAVGRCGRGRRIIRDRGGQVIIPKGGSLRTPSSSRYVPWGSNHRAVGGGASCTVLDLESSKGGEGRAHPPPVCWDNRTRGPGLWGGGPLGLGPGLNSSRGVTPISPSRRHHTPTPSPQRLLIRLFRTVQPCDRQCREHVQSLRRAVLAAATFRRK